jgi:hypothetical protein
MVLTVKKQPLSLLGPVWIAPPAALPIRGRANFLVTDFAALDLASRGRR